jgi:hypothetical protein
MGCKDGRKRVHYKLLKYGKIEKLKYWAGATDHFRDVAEMVCANSKFNLQNSKFDKW